jgi:hypothetical protein
LRDLFARKKSFAADRGEVQRFYYDEVTPSDMENQYVKPGPPMRQPRR